MGSPVTSRRECQQGCSVLLLPVAPDELVSELLQRLEDSVNMDEPPNPSVLLAMNLAGATDSSTHKWLLQEIKEEAVKRAQKGKDGQGVHHRRGTPSRHSRYCRFGQEPGCHVVAPP